MNKTTRKNKYIAPNIIEIDIESTTILAGSRSPKTDGNKADFNGTENTNESWDGAKAPMRQDIGAWSEEE